MTWKLTCEWNRRRRLWIESTDLSLSLFLLAMPAFSRTKPVGGTIAPRRGLCWRKPTRASRQTGAQVSGVQLSSYKASGEEARVAQPGKSAIGNDYRINSILCPVIDC